MITHIQDAIADVDASTTSISVALTGVAAGSLIALAVKWEGADTTLVVSDGTSELSERIRESHANGDVHVALFDLLVANSGNRTYTVTLGAARPYKRMAVYEEGYTETIEFDDSAGDSGTWTGADQPGSAGVMTGSGSADHFAVGAYGEYASIPWPTDHTIDELAADDVLQIVHAQTWRRHFSAGFEGEAACIGGPSAPWIVVGGVWKEVTLSTMDVNDRIPIAQQEPLTDAAVVSPLRVFNGQLPRQFRATTTGTDGGAGHYTTTFDPEFGG